MKINVLGLLLLIICFLTGCNNNSNKTANELSESSIAFSEKTFKNNPDQNLFNLVYHKIGPVILIILSVILIRGIIKFIKKMEENKHFILL